MRLESVTPLLLILATLATKAWADIPITVTTNVAEPRVIDTYTMAELAKRAGYSNLPYIGGYFDGQVTREFTLDINTAEGAGGLMLAVNSATLHIDIPNALVYLGSDMPSTCIRQESLKHELQHYAYRQQILPSYKERFKAALRRELAQSSGQVIPNGQQDVYTQALYNSIYAALDQVIVEFYTEMTRLDAIIDNTESYASVSALCR